MRLVLDMLIEEGDEMGWDGMIYRQSEWVTILLKSCGMPGGGLASSGLCSQCWARVCCGCCMQSVLG